MLIFHYVPQSVPTPLLLTKRMGPRYLGIDWPPFLGYLPLWRGNQEFSSPGTLSYNRLEKNLVVGRKSKIKK